MSLPVGFCFANSDFHLAGWQALKVNKDGIHSRGLQGVIKRLVLVCYQNLPSFFKKNMCDFDDGKCCGDCFQREPDRVCSVCEIKLDDDEHTEHRTCDMCKNSGCQHTITSYSDEDFEYERYYCFECAQERRSKEKIYA